MASRVARGGGKDGLVDGLSDGHVEATMEETYRMGVKMEALSIPDKKEAEAVSKRTPRRSHRVPEASSTA